MDRVARLSWCSVRRGVVALGVLLTVVSTTPAVVATETATVRSTQTLASARAPSPTLGPCLACWIIPPLALLSPAVQMADDGWDGA